MTGNTDNTDFNFLCERKLSFTDADLHKSFKNSVFAIDLLLAGYKSIFPFYTDHTIQHSEQVINYCNIIAGEEIINSLNPDEIYILLMGASLHDVGMGISKADFEEMSEMMPEVIKYVKEHPGETVAEYTRVFHQQFSAQFINKYSGLFEIPAEEYVYCIARVARGHRKADLLNTDEYPTDYLLPNGNKVNLAFLSALVKFADELDITSERNLLFDYSDFNSKWSEKQTMCYKCHGAIKKLSAVGDSLILYYDTDEEKVEKEIMKTKSKVEKTFGEYNEIIKKRTSFTNRINSVLFEKITK